MKLAIVEDDTFHRESLLTNIRNYTLFREPSIDVVLCTGNPQDVIHYIASNHIDCYLLDIELSAQIDGMALAQLIRKKDPFAQIIFITSHADRLPLTFTYKLAALDFIVKSSSEQMIDDVMEALHAASLKYRQIGKTDASKWFQIKVGEKIKNIRLQDIYYIQSSLHPHKLELHEKNGRHTFYGTLKDLTALGDEFFRCHKSCMLNLAHVVEVNLIERSAVMTDGSTCPVSFRLMRALQKRMNNFSN